MEHSQDIINECWRSIDGYINYQASNIGRVRNAYSGQILAAYCNRKGYATVCLCKDGKRKTWKIHQLVAMCFIPKPDSDERFEVDHINQDKTNNSISNLMWKTSRQNKWNRNKINKATSSKYIGVCFDKRRLTWKASVRLNDGNSKHIGYFHDEKDAAHAYNAKAYELRGNFTVLNDISDDEH
jgi:hypothetical protein